MPKTQLSKIKHFKTYTKDVLIFICQSLKYPIILPESCKTVGSSAKPCIFPFTYADRTYDKCITRDSDTGARQFIDISKCSMFISLSFKGQPWCATEVDADGWVVDHAWGDCDEGCPGTRKYDALETTHLRFNSL